MKKYITIAALLAAGTACANAESITNAAFDALLAQEIAGYEEVLDFEIEFTIDSNTYDGYTTAPVFTLATGWYLSSQIGNYLGFSNEIGKVEGDLTTTSATYTSSNKSEATGTVTVSSSNGWFYKIDGLNTLNVTLTEDSLVLTKGTGDSPTEVADFTFSSKLDLTKFVLGDHITNVSNVSIVVPEPSAFGLLAGIGALALVASRRRRK